MTNITYLVDILQMVSGLDDGQARTCIYYDLATHELDRFTFMPILEISGPLGSGKSQIQEFMGRFCYSPRERKCLNITVPALRDELRKAYRGTFIGDEADCIYRPVEDLYGVRCSASGNVTIKEKKGKSDFKQKTVNIFGATVLHHRRPFLDPSNASRAITIKTSIKPGDYVKMEQFKNIQIDLPQIPSGDMLPALGSGRAYDTWYPLLDVATRAGDIEWLAWAEHKIKESEKEVEAGQTYESNAVILAKLIESCVESHTSKLKPIIDRVNIHLEIVQPLVKEYPWVNSYNTPMILRGMGIEVVRQGGKNWAYPTAESLKAAATNLGYQDETFN